MIGSGINQFLILLIGLFTARYLGPKDYGIISLASSINIIFIFLMVLGFHHYITREVARDPTTASYFFSGMIWLKIIILIPLLIIVFAFMSLLGYNSLIINITIITTGSFIVNSFNSSFYAIVQAKNDMKIIASGNAITGILTFIGISIIIVLKADIYAFVFVPLCINALMFIGLLITIFIKYHLVLDNIFLVKSFFKTHILKAIPFGITGLFVVFYMWEEFFWISLFHGEEMVGYYNVAFSLVTATFIVSQGVNMAVYPILSNLYLRDNSSVKHLFNTQIKIMSILSILIVVFMCIFANNLINVLLGHQYTKSIIILEILVFIIPLVFIRSAFERLLEITGNQAKVTISYGFACIVNLILNILLIYYFDVIGASFTLIITEVVIFVITFYYTRKITL